MLGRYAHARHASETFYNEVQVGLAERVLHDDNIPVVVEAMVAQDALINDDILSKFSIDFMAFQDSKSDGRRKMALKGTKENLVFIVYFLVRLSFLIVDTSCLCLMKLWLKDLIFVARAENWKEIFDGYETFKYVWCIFLKCLF